MTVTFCLFLYLWIMSGKLEAIWIKRMKLGPMDPKSSATLIAGKGLQGNANIGGKRQVTIIEKEIWENHNQKLNTNLPPSGRRANLMISGLSLLNSRGKILKIGECLLKINGETKPCERMDELHKGLKDVMYENWGGGAYAEVLKEGEIKEGDTVSWES